MDSPQRAVTSFLTCNKIQDGGRPPFWKTENRNISAAVSAIVTKFGKMLHMESLQRALTSFLTCMKIQVGGGRHFEKKKNVHDSAAVWVIFAQFGMLVAIDSPQRFLMSLLVYNKIQGLFIFLFAWIWTENVQWQTIYFITKLLVKWIIKQQILLIKTVTILSRVV